MLAEAVHWWPTPISVGGLLAIDIEHDMLAFDHRLILWCTKIGWPNM
jgi:hypothetical protein